MEIEEIKDRIEEILLSPLYLIYLLILFFELKILKKDYYTCPFCQHLTTGHNINKCEECGITVKEANEILNRNVKFVEEKQNGVSEKHRVWG